MRKSRMIAFVKLIFLPLAVISVLCTGAVEGFYYWVTKYKLGSVSKVEKVEGSIRPDGKKRVVEKRQILPEDYNIIFKRNLFSVHDFPGKEESETDSLEGMEISSLDVVLMGTVFSAGGSERAIIYDRSDRKQEIYQVGDYIQQAVIKKILRGKVVLNYNGTDEMLDISEARNVSVPKPIAKVKPIVQNQRVTGRPTGQPAVNQLIKQNIPVPGSPGMDISPSQVQKQLRSFRGGVTVNSAAPE